MTKRFLIALCVTLSFVARTAAQPPDAPPTAPEARSNSGPLTSFLLAPAPEAFSPDRQAWATSEYLFAWMRGAELPPLVTTSPAGTARADAGVLGANGTETLFGGQVNGNGRSGIRLGAGYWFNPEHSLGVEVGFMMLENRAALFSAASTDGAILARPYIDANSGLPQAVLVAFPGSSNGSIDIRAASGNLYTGHFDLTEKALDVGWYRLNSLLGYRFYRYDENLRIQQTVTATNPAFIAGTQIATNDNFGVRNQFHGVDLGFRSHFYWQNFSLEVLTKVAIGRLTRQVDIGGDQTITVPGAAPVVQSGGVLTGSTNSGTFNYSDWKTMPEAGLTFNWQIRSNVNVRLGYSFLFLDSITRAADHIDVTLNPNLFPNGNAADGGPNRPAFNAIRSYQWIQTLNFGLEFTY